MQVKNQNSVRMSKQYDAPIHTVVYFVYDICTYNDNKTIVTYQLFISLGLFTHLIADDVTIYYVTR